MTQSKRHTIIAENATDDFVGREAEIERLMQHVSGDGQTNGLCVLSTPLAGSSELLRQVYDRLFTSQSDVIPFYFAMSESDISGVNAALRFAKDFLTQAVAFRRRDANILDASPGFDEISELAISADGYWIDRLIETYLKVAEDTDIRSVVRSCLSAPLRARASGAGVFVIIDNIHQSACLDAGDAFFESVTDIFTRDDMRVVIAGHRRFLFGKTPFVSMPIDHLDLPDAWRLGKILAANYGVAVNEQTIDLIALQNQGNPAFIKFLFAAACAKGEALDSFQNVERVYTDEIFGGRISNYYDGIFDRIIPDRAVQVRFLRLISDVTNSTSKNAPIAFWQKHSGLSAHEFSSIIRSLNDHEIVSLDGGSIEVMHGNATLGDYLNGRFNLEVEHRSRAQVVGETLADLVQRAPQLMARYYRQRSAIGLREVMQAFDGRPITPALLDYSRYKGEFKGAGDDKILKAASVDNDKINLPKIVYTAHTETFYRQIGDLLDAERSAVALGFAEDSEIVWIAAEIDSKLEAARDTAEFWCDRLEMVAANCGFEQYKLWLVAPEGFDADAMSVLRDRNAFGSSRKQVDLLVQFLNVKELAGKNSGAKDYEIVLPMGDETEMISAHTVEEIAKQHNFPPKIINQIKTALVEACINAAEHSLSPDRKVYLKFTVDEEKITITVSNRGLRMSEPGAVTIGSDLQQPTSPDTGRRGWGLKLIKGLMDDVRIEETDDGTRITMVKFLNKA